MNAPQPVAAPPMMFASDNTGPAHPKVMEAVMRANEGHAMPYGADPIMEGVRGRLREVLGWPDAAVHLVATGTAGNALALACLARPWSAVFCATHAHVEEDECNAPEFYTGGAKLVLVDGAGGKMAPEALAAAIAGQETRGVPRPPARARHDHAGDREGHRPHAGGARRAPGRGGGAAAAHGRRAVRQRGGLSRLHGGPDGGGLRRGDLRRHQERADGRGGRGAARSGAWLGVRGCAASGARICSPSTATSARRWRPTSRTICGSRRRAPRTPPARG